MDKVKVLGLISARGGSKGLPGKNIYPVCGLPLIAWTILAARKARLIDRLILSSDDQAIIDVAKYYGCEVPFSRPENLATDEATSVDVAVHALETLPEKYDLLVLLQPTSPLRTAEDIDGAVQLLLDTQAPSVVSVAISNKSPYWMLQIDENGSLEPLLSSEVRPKRRQDAPCIFLPNGAVYVVSSAVFLEQRNFLLPGTRPWIMPERRSIDIDLLEDIQYLEWLCRSHPEWIPEWNSDT